MFSVDTGYIHGLGPLLQSYKSPAYEDNLLSLWNTKVHKRDLKNLAPDPIWTRYLNHIRHSHLFKNQDARPLKMRPTSSLETTAKY